MASNPRALGVRAGSTKIRNPQSAIRNRLRLTVRPLGGAPAPILILRRITNPCGLTARLQAQNIPRLRAAAEVWADIVGRAIVAPALVNSRDDTLAVE